MKDDTVYFHIAMCRAKRNRVLKVHLRSRKNDQLSKVKKKRKKLG